jgi:hypothetical protein
MSAGALKKFFEAGGLEIEMSGDGLDMESLLDAAARSTAAPTVVQSCSTGGAAMTTVIKGPS